jgi:hypothetical protein
MLVGGGFRLFLHADLQRSLHDHLCRSDWYSCTSSSAAFFCFILVALGTLQYISTVSDVERKETFPVTDSTVLKTSV